MHPKSIIKLLSIILMGLSAVMLIPAATGIYYHESKGVVAFLSTFALLGVFSFSLFLLTKKENLQNFSPKDAYIFTAFAWITATAFGALPFVFTGTLKNYSDAFFEVMSGFTTTGATRLTDIDGCIKSILLWRALTNWLGGMGIVVLFVSLLPAIGNGAGGFFLMGAETVGPVKSKLTPKTRTTAKVLWLIYIGMTVLEILLLLPSKIGLFDCITTTFSTVSTAGFTSHNASVGAFNNGYADVVITIFMLLAGINFSLYYKIITGKIKEIRKDTELKVYLTIIGAAILVGAISLTLNGYYPSFDVSARYVAFQVVSIITTTGFTTANYLTWPTSALFVLVIMMFIGGCAGSTGGGIKVIRLITSFRASVNVIKKKAHPNAVYHVIIDNHTVPEPQVSSILSYIFLYIATWLIGAFIISFTGLDIQSCLSSSILTLGNIGAGFGIECFATMPHWVNWILSALMLMGRLELFTIFVLLVK